MSSDEARVASAYILIQARKDPKFNEEVRRTGEQAGKQYEDGFERESDKEFKAAKPKRQRRGRQAGEDIGVPAGAEAGKQTSDGISEALARSRRARERDGQTLGQALGDAIGRTAGRRAAVLTRAQVQREFAAEAKYLAAQAKVQAREQATAQKTAARAAAVEARFVTQQARLRAKEEAEARKAAERAKAEFDKSMQYFLGRADATGRGISTALSRGLAGSGGSGGRSIIGRVLSVGGIGAGASALSGLGTLLAGTVGAVTQLSGVLGVLPGGFAAAGIGAATLKVGVLGVGDAISEGLSGKRDMKKYNAALKQLSPNAREFTKALVRLRPELKDLRNSVQDGLFKGVGDQVRLLGDRYLPIAEKGLTRVARAFNLGGREVGNFLDSGSRAKLISTIFSDTGRASEHLGASLKPVVQALLDVTSVGASLLPGLTKELEQAAGKLSAFTTRSRRNGSMREFFEGGIDAAKDFARVVGGAGRILAGIFKAGGGAAQSPLATAADLLGKIADQVGRPEFQAGLGDFFSSIRDAGASVGAVLPHVADALVAMEPAIASIVRGSGAALAATLNAAASAATALAPTLNVLAHVFEALGPHAGAVVIGLLAVRGALAALKAAAGIADAIGSVGTNLEKIGLKSAGARTKVASLGGALGLASKAATAFGVAVVAQQAFGLFTKGADASVVSAGALTNALKKFQNGVDTGNVQGLGNNFEKLGEQLNKAADPTVLRRVQDIQGKVASKLTSILTGGKSDGSGKGGFFSLDTGVSSAGGKQATELAKSLKEADGYLAGLVGSGNGAQAAELFQRLNDAAVKGGAGIGELAGKLPGFTAALTASGGSLDATKSKVIGLGVSLSDLTRETESYADKALAARGSSRAYAASLDEAKQAAKANGKTLKESTEAGRANAEALDGIAAAGIRYAQSIIDNGGSERAFQGALKQTKSDLVAAGIRFGLSKKAAEQYANSILRIPKGASTSIRQYGIEGALVNARLLADRLANIPRRVTTLVKTQYLEVFGSEVERDKNTARRGKAYGGLIPRGLGSPRQDNIPTWLSSGEFVVNALAVRAPGVEELLRQINATGRIPRFADGGKIGRTLNSVTGTVNRTVPVASSSSNTDPGVIAAAVAAAVAQEIRKLSIRLDSGALAGAVYDQGGKVW